MDAQTQLYYCFGCHKGGTAIHFVMEMERLDFIDAVKMLAERAHMELPEGGAPGNPAPAGEKERIFEANVAAAHFFHGVLWTDEGAEVLDYLYRRGLSDADIRRFGLGASPKGWDALLKQLTTRGFEEDLLERAGLVVRREGGAYDMFRARAIFPIISAQGKVLGFGGRAMGDSQPKYLNTPDTPVFNKRRGLYALNFAKSERNAGRLVLVEGYMDVVSLRKHGVEGVVATLGTALTEEQARLMKRYAPEVLVSYDGDGAGQKAALRALDILEASDVPAKVADYPDGMDPDDFIRARGLSGFEALKKYGATEYRMLRARDGLDISTQEGMTQYALRACEILRRVKSPIELENHLRRLAVETGYDREILARQIGSSAPKEERLAGARRERAAERPDEAELAERVLLSMLAEGKIPREMVVSSDFEGGINRKAAEWLIAGKAVNAFLEQLDEETRAVLLPAINYAPLPEELEEAQRMAEESLVTIRQVRRRRALAALEEEAKVADGDRRRELYKKIQKLLAELE